jgi:heme/copper-type cytochrome/quinol oxidase subunit 2
VLRLAAHPLRRQLSRIIPTFLSDIIFWLATACCALAQAAIVRSALRARAQRPDGTASPPRLIEVAWTVVPAVMLAMVLVFTWRALHPAPTIPIVP